MESIPHELIMEIFKIIHMPDKRNFTRCNKYLNKISMTKDEENFTNMLNDTIFGNGPKATFTNLARYTLEIIYYGYINLLPARYLNVTNVILYKCSKIFFHCSKKNYFETVKVMIELNKKIMK